MSAASLNDLVSSRQQRFRDGEAEGLGGLEVDDKLKLGRLQDRQVGGLSAIENFAGIDASLTKTVCDVRSVAHQPAGYDEITDRIRRRNTLARRQAGNLHAAAGKDASAATKRASGRSRARPAKAASISPLVLALKAWICSPMTRAASCTRKLT